MADHDLAAELLGYRNELARYERLGAGGRAAAVRKAIKRVQDDVRAEAERLEADAQRYTDVGQGVPAAIARNEARRYRALLDDGQDEAGDGGQGAAQPARRGQGRPRKETTADKTPKERA